VRQFVELAFEEVDIKIEWWGEGVDERGVDRASGRTLIKVDPRYFRPAEVDLLWGDPTKARTLLKWHPKTTLKDLVRIMVQYDLRHDSIGGEDI
jgi:GDPmannose 4,6-dehydratase